MFKILKVAKFPNYKQLYDYHELNYICYVLNAESVDNICILYSLVSVITIDNICIVQWV